MSSAEIKVKVQTAYMRALSSNVQVMRDSSFHAQFRDLKIYGREAGIDLVQTNIDWFVREAVCTAECRKSGLSLPFYGFGRQAIEGIADALRDLTALEVDVTQNVVKLSWADTTPRLK